MIAALYVLFVLNCFFLILVVLLQAGKGDSLTLFSGGSESILGARGAATFLSKLTVASATLFMVLSIILAYHSSNPDLRVGRGVVDPTEVPGGLLDGEEEEQGDEAVEGEDEDETQPEDEDEGETEAEPEDQPEGETQAAAEAQAEGSAQAVPEGEPEGEGEGEGEAETASESGMEGESEVANEGQTEGAAQAVPEAETEGETETEEQPDE